MTSEKLETTHARMRIILLVARSKIMKVKCEKNLQFVLRKSCFWQYWETFQGKAQKKLFLPYGRMVTWKCAIKAAKIRPVRVTRGELDVKQDGARS